MMSPILAQRVYSLDGICFDNRRRMIVCATRPFSLDEDGYFSGKLLYSNPLTMWSDIVGYRRTFESDRPNEFIFVEMPHLTAKMRLHALREEAFDDESPDAGISYTGNVFDFVDSPIAASAIAKERLEMYRRSHLPPKKLTFNTELCWTLKSK